MTLELIDGAAENSETHESITDMIARLEEEIHGLKVDLKNMTYEKDCQFDRAENLQTDLKDTQEELKALREDDNYMEVTEDQRRLLEISEELKSCYERLSMGVNTEIDRIIELTNEIMEMRT